MTAVRWWRDPFRVSVAVFGLVVVGGFVAMGLGWRLVDDTEVVGLQVPPIVSGGIGGLGLIALGVGLATIQLGRQRAADERADLEGALAEAIAIADALRAGGERAGSPKRRGARRA
jgi:hypothetical protein